MSKYTLPNGAKFEGIIYDMIEIDEIRGRHQDILVNPNPKTPFDYIEPIFTDIIKDITDKDSNSILSHISKRDLILHHLPIQDIQFILIKLRENSYGKDYILDLECPHCTAVNAAKLDLSQLEIIPRVDKLEEDKLILPKEGIKVGYKHMSLANLLKMNFEDENSQFMKSVKTSVVAFRVASLGDNLKVQAKDVQDLRALDIEFIEENAPDLAEPDMKAEHKCVKCSEDFKEDISTRVLAADFLYRSRT